MTPKDKKLLLILLIAFTGLSITIGWLAEFIIQSFPLSLYRIGLRIACILIDLLILARILHLMLLKSGMRPRRQKLTMAVGGFAIIVLLLEIPFMFVPYSHGNGNTYSSRIWFDRYWETNSWGYRDREHGLKEASQKTKVMFLGDSFVAGHGIKNPADRISDIVAEEMGDQFEIHNLGRNGADSKVELKNLVAYPVKPDIVILSHIPNDIEHVNQPGTQQGFGPSQSTPDQEMVIPEPHLAGIGFLRFLSEGSFTLNYIYWKFNGFIEGVESVDLQEKPEDFGDSYITRYFDPPALAEHHADLQQIISWCKIREIPLLFLTFPETYDGAIDFTQNEINLPLANWLRPQNIPVLHAYDALKPIPMKDRIVNFNDLHPSEQAHQAVAELLMQKLKELGWLD